MAESGASASVVEVRGVAKTYPNGTHALAPVDFDVRRGEFVTLLGPSGCGKTTLLNLIAGLISPSVGTLRWWNGDFAATGVPGKRFAFVFQSPTLMPWARVRGNVRLSLDLAHTDRSDAERAVDDVLSRVGLRDFDRHLPRELSGGMQMRVSIARALVNQPDLLLMDEPFAALDEFTRQKLDTDLLELWRARALTVVFVTHSIHEAVFLSTRVAVMAARPGRILGKIAIDVPYPRPDDFRTSTVFASYAQHLSRLVAEAGAGAAPATTG